MARLFQRRYECKNAFLHQPSPNLFKGVAFYTNIITCALDRPLEVPDFTFDRGSGVAHAIITLLEFSFMLRIPCTMVQCYDLKNTWVDIWLECLVLKIVRVGAAQFNIVRVDKKEKVPSSSPNSQENTILGTLTLTGDFRCNASTSLKGKP